MRFDCVRAAQTTDEAAAIEVKRAALRQKPQEFFGIDEPNLSPSAWADAIAELKPCSTLSFRQTSFARYCVRRMLYSQHSLSVRTRVPLFQ